MQGDKRVTACRMEMRQLSDRDLVTKGEHLMYEEKSILDKHDSVIGELSFLTNPEMIKERVSVLKESLQEIENEMKEFKMVKDCNYQEMKNRGFVCSCGFMLNPFDGPVRCDYCGYSAPERREQKNI